MIYQVGWRRITLDRNSTSYRPAREESFKYLTFFATENVLEKALTILKKNEHYQWPTTLAILKLHVATLNDHFPQDLSGKLNVLLGLVKTRKCTYKKVLTILADSV